MNTGYLTVLLMIITSVGLVTRVSGSDDKHMLQPMAATDPDHSSHEKMLQNKHYSRVRQIHQLPRVTLTNQDGKKVFLPDLLEGKQPVLLNFIYTTCTTICPVLSASFADVHNKLGSAADNITMVSISIDPEHDSPRKMREYALRFNAHAGWTFLTGDLADTVDVLRSFNAYRRDKMGHIPLTFMRVSSDASWIRLEGFPTARELIEEYSALSRSAILQHGADQY